jgi:hypothetical protein
MLIIFFYFELVLLKIYYMLFIAYLNVNRFMFAFIYPSMPLIFKVFQNLVHTIN